MLELEQFRDLLGESMSNLSSDELEDFRVFLYEVAAIGYDMAVQKQEKDKLNQALIGTYGIAD